jgi:hypothetical protein
MVGQEVHGARREPARPRRLAQDAEVLRLLLEALEFAAGTDAHREVVVGIVADVEIDAAIARDQDRLARHREVPRGDGGDGKAHAREEEQDRAPPPAGCGRPALPAPRDPGGGRRDRQQDVRRGDRRQPPQESRATPRGTLPRRGQVPNAGAQE